MDYLKGFTFGWMNKQGDFEKPEARESLSLLQKRTNCSHVIFALAALQNTAQTVDIDYRGKHMVTDQELTEMIRYAQSMGLQTILKPTVNVKDGTWRAHINFFDHDVVCEPKWSEWFASYLDYQLHYARLAEETGCEMLIVGCEMVQAERRADEWRELIAEVRQHYKGLISYNTDKYQEGNVIWWDAVDVISSSAYYPIDDWDQQLKRIEKVVAEQQKPFFFAEAGCPSRTGSAHLPNDWSLVGETNVQEQADYYRIMFDMTSQYAWIRGFGLWDWNAKLYPADAADSDNGYGIFAKPEEQIVMDFYKKI